MLILSLVELSNVTIWARDLFQGFLNYKFNLFHSYIAIHIISNLTSCGRLCFSSNGSFILSYIYRHSCS